jgi:hypothetical protein
MCKKEASAADNHALLHLQDKSHAWLPALHLMSAEYTIDQQLTKVVLDHLVLHEAPASIHKMT